MRQLACRQVSRPSPLGGGRRGPTRLTLWIHLLTNHSNIYMPVAYIATSNIYIQVHNINVSTVYSTCNSWNFLSMVHVYIVLCVLSHRHYFHFHLHLISMCPDSEVNNIGQLIDLFKTCLLYNILSSKVQRNLPKLNPNGPSVLNSEVSLIQGLSTQMWHLGQMKVSCL